MSVSLLGGVEVSGSDAPLAARALALLAYLVAHAGVRQPRGHLAEVLWPDSDAAQARTNLRRELHHLRSAVDATGCLEVAGGALAWHDGPGCVVDVRTFLEGRRRAIDALEAGSADFAKHVQQALSCYRGAFLPGCYDDWALLARAELQDACVDLCDRGAAFHERQGDCEAAIVLQRRRIGLEPLEERGYRRLMSLQHAVGDRAGAMRTYHRCASVLEQELGVTPSPETRAELDELLADHGSLTRTTKEPESGGGFSPSTPGLVGRAAERTRLRGLWSDAPAGTRLVMVTGEAGVGKTRLVADLAAEVRKQDGVVATAHCFAATVGLPLAPVAEWLRSPHLRLAASRLDPVWRREVARLVPESAGTNGPDDPDNPDNPAESSRAKVDAWQRLRFFEGLARAVLSVDRPVLLVVDDLHWCDTATLSWLSFLMSLPTTAPVLVVGTAREDELRPNTPLGAMTTAGQVVSVRLGPLTLEATAELADALMDRPLSEEELGLVHSVTAGNPFYVIEALREARASAGPMDPADLRGVLSSRISRLSPPGQQVLGLAAAVGRDFKLDLLTEACDLDRDTVVQSVDELWRRRILEQRGPGYVFAHDLLREAAYDAVPPARRWLVHRRLAQALELLYVDRTESVAAQLAEQYDLSGQPERALPFYDRAASRAASVFAHAEAVRLWQRCSELLEATPGGRGRDERELTLIEQLLPPLNAWRGYASTELESYERRSYELGRRLELTRVQATASIALFATTYVQGHIGESHDWGERALLLSEECPDLAGQAHMAYAGPALAMGEVESASEHFALACELSGMTDSLPIGTRTAVHARGWGAHALWLLGDEIGAGDAADEAVDVAVGIDHPYSQTVALAYAAVTHQMRGDRASLERVLGELTRVCERYEFAYYRDWATVLSGWSLGGRAGIAMARRGIDLLEREGSLARMPYWLWLLADLHRSDGDAEGAVGILDASEVVCVQNADVWWLPEVLRSRAALDPARSGEDLRRAVALAAAQGSTTLLRRCEADLA